MRTPYTYGYGSDPMFTANRPGVELWRGNECDSCGPGGVVNRGAIRMAGITPVPSGTYMGPVGKVVNTAGMRGYGYSSGPGIPDQVFLEHSPTSRAMSFMSNIGIATRGMRGVARLSGRGMGDAAQDREMCRGISTAIGGVGTAARDVNARTADGTTTRDAGWNQAGQYLAAGSQFASAFCNLIRDNTTPVQTQPQGTLMPPGYTYPPSGYQQPTPGPAAGTTTIPTWAIPAGIAAVVAVAGAVILLK
jgi:hypothetical protein